MKGSKILSFEEFVKFVSQGETDQMPMGDVMPSANEPMPAETPKGDEAPGSGTIDLQLMDEPAGQADIGNTQMTGDLPLTDSPMTDDNTEIAED